MPLNVAGGLEYRRETYTIDPGIPDSYLAGGAQSYAGFAPVSSGTHDRKNQAVYIDLAGKLLEKLRFDAAARYEHYSDFGNVTAGKLSLKYDLTPVLGLRATASNGFRAPTLAEAFYTSTNVAPSSAQVQVQPDSAAAHLLGLGNLQAEKSVNLSFGLVWHPLPQVMTTLDVYQISITNRITGTGALYGLINGAPQQYSGLVNNVVAASGQSIEAGGAIQTTSIQLFANGIDTRTRGADLTFKIPQELRFGHIDYTLSATYSKTELTNTPPVLPSAPDAPLYDPIAISEITTANPLYVVNAGLTWTYEKLSINVLEKLYGPSKAYENADADLSTDVIDYIGFTPITNINVSYQLNKNVRADLGALNLFNRYPPRINALAYNTMVNLGDYTSVEQYPEFSPFGIDGGFYYAKLTFSF